jgi:hypothetical protein
MHSAIPTAKYRQGLRAPLDVLTQSSQSLGISAIQADVSDEASHERHPEVQHVYSPVPGLLGEVQTRMTDLRLVILRRTIAEQLAHNVTLHRSPILLTIAIPEPPYITLLTAETHLATLSEPVKPSSRLVEAPSVRFRLTIQVSGVDTSLFPGDVYYWSVCRMKVYVRRTGQAEEVTWTIATKSNLTP